MDRKMLAIYLNDHLAGSVAGRELARRAAGNNRGSAYGDFLSELAREVEEDRQALVALMGDLGIGVDPLKVAGGWAAEKVGRLKPNGRLLSYSPMSRVVEIEALALGVRGKLSLWVALEQLGQVEPDLADARLPELIARAERQASGLEELRVQAVRDAVAG